ncbi:MAG: methyltransferase family protein [Anaerolineae bacterium]
MVSTRGITPRAIVQAVLVVLVLPFLPLLVSGRWDWRAAWVYGIVSVLGFVLSRVLAARRHPDIVAERARFQNHEDTKPWDRVLSLWLLLASVALLVVAGLDARLDWTPGHSIAAKSVALLAMLAGYAISSYALIENRYFSAVVRLQTDRGQQVVSTGPYAWVRHPGYAGGIIVYLATPLLLSSLWAYIPVAVVIALTMYRTAREDLTLQEELAGYQEYAAHVRYRLVPGVW